MTTQCDPPLAPAPWWHVVWTRSHCEQTVSDQLSAKGFHPFVPSFEVWSRRRDRKQLVRVPMFPGYVFLHDALDKHQHVEVRKARGLVRILGDRWDQPAVVPDEEIDGLRRLVESRLPAAPHIFLKEGQRVRITGGPLKGIEGLLVQARPNRGVLILSVELLQRSVAVEVDCTQVTEA